MSTINGVPSETEAAPFTKSVHVPDYLTPDQVDALRKAARRSSRHAHRDECLVMLMAAHGLRCKEAIELRWDDIHLDSRAATIYVRRAKKGNPSTHPICGPEIRALRQLRREWPDNNGLVFCSERGGPLDDSAVRRIIARLGEEAGLPFRVHPHQLRHAAGYRLINQPGVNLRQVQDFLGHKNVGNTVRYTQLTSEPFRNLEPAFSE